MDVKVNNWVCFYMLTLGADIETIFIKSANGTPFTYVYRNQDFILFHDILSSYKYNLMKFIECM